MNKVPEQPFTDLDCQRVIDAVIDYEMDEVRKKMELHHIDFDMALQMQMAVIAASGDH